MKIIKVTKSIKKRILQAFVKFDIVCVSALFESELKHFFLSRKVPTKLLLRAAL